MRNPLYTASAANLGLLAVRVPLGVYFAWAGINKFKGGIGNFVEGAKGMLPDFLPSAVGQTYLYALPAVEVLVGACIVLGLFSRIAGLLATLMLVSFTIAATGVKSGNSTPFHPNVIYTGIALMIFLIGTGGISFDRMIWKRGGVTPH